MNCSSCEKRGTNKDDETDSGEAPVGSSVEDIVEDLERHEADDVPVIHVENPNKPE